ncbi:MAG: PorT family protein [Mediterranea sp.]|jgi:hypothetical protein|nr:PorT family protein [Mediterranea sp.]
MKKILIVAALAMVSVASYAQVSWNVKAGMNISTFINDEEADAKVGYSLGVGMEYRFNPLFSIQPSLLFTTKGASGKASLANIKVTPKYLELPIMAAFRFAVGNEQNIVVKAGPYLAYGIGGKYSVTVNGINLSFPIFKDTSLGTDYGNMDVPAAERFDFGLGLGVDYEIKHFFIGLNGEFGLTKLYSLDPNSSKNMNFTIGVGYKF